MGGLIPDTVASIRLPNEITTSPVVMALVAGVQWTSGHGMQVPQTLHLTSYPESATDGADITLACTPAQDKTSISVNWYRNNVHIFDTGSDADISDDILNPLTTSPEYQSVSGRISVSSSLQQHNVTLRTNSTLDQGSMWRCQTGPQLSNNLTIEFKESNQDTSRAEEPQTPHLTSYPEAATDGADFTLSCTPAQGRTWISVAWHRNNIEIFDTSSNVDASDAILHPLTTSPEYQSVSGRISVSSSLQQHNMTLRANTPLDQGSVWRCRTGPWFSNNLTIYPIEFIQDRSRAEGPKSTTDTTSFATEGQNTGPSTTGDTDMMTTNPIVSTKTPFIHTAEFIYVVAGSAGGVVIVVIIVIVVLLCKRSRREGKSQTNDKTEKDNAKEGAYNEESERETIVMEDNDLYHGFVRTENQESAEEQQVADVYAKVNKVRKTHNATEVHITLSIEDLYAKPNKPSSGKRKAASKVSSSQITDVNTPD